MDRELKDLHDKLKLALTLYKCDMVFKLTILSVCKDLKKLYLAERSKSRIVKD